MKFNILLILSFPVFLTGYDQEQISVMGHNYGKFTNEEVKDRVNALKMNYK